MPLRPLALALALAGCGPAVIADAGVEACVAPEGFELGDPVGHAAPLDVAAGEARAGLLVAEDLPPDPDGLRTWQAGDFVLANERIAAVVEALGVSDDFNPNGGQLVGVARMQDGALAESPPFGEATFTFGRTTIAPESVTVLADGSDGGPAVVRAVGPLTDLGFLVFVGELLGGGAPPEVRVALDYSLAPGAEHVEVTARVLNPTAEPVSFRKPLIVSAQQNRMRAFAPGPGFDLSGSTPPDWIGFVGEAAAGYALEGEGLRVFLEQSNFLFLDLARFVAPACERSEHALARVHVGGPGADGLIAAVERGRGQSRAAISGRVMQSDGAAAAGARVYARDSEGALLSRAETDADGQFVLHAPEGVTATLSAWRRGDARGASLEASAPASGQMLALGPSGAVQVDVVDGDGAPLPAFVQLIPADEMLHAPEGDAGETPIARGRVNVAYGIGGPLDLRAPAGEHRLVVSHGFEHTMYDEPVSVTDGSLTAVSVVLEHTVPTPGVMCGDFHVHTNRSFDAEDGARLKLRAAAAAHLEIPLRSEHLWVRDFEPLIAEMGLSEHLFGIPSLELTTFAWGHFGVFPLTPDPAGRNGGTIDWFERTPAEVLGESRSREGSAGRSELIINHPRELIGLLGYFTAAGYDATTGAAVREDLWYDEFVLLEVFNSSDFDANEALVEDWFSFLSRGRRVMAIGSSDSHEVSRTPMGYPRTCLDVGVDTPPALRALGAGHVRDAAVAGASTIVGGVFVEPLAAGEVGPGGTVQGASATESVTVTVRAASWVGVDRLRAFVDGELAATIVLDEDTVDPLLPTVRFAGAVDVEVSDAGSYVVFVADGGGTLAPVHPGRRPFGVSNPIFFER